MKRRTCSLSLGENLDLCPSVYLMVTASARGFQVGTSMHVKVNRQERAKFTIDFHPAKSEASTGTLVPTFESNLNFTEKMLAGLGVSLDQFEFGGGEYFTDDEFIRMHGGLSHEAMSVASRTAASGAAQRSDGRQHAQASGSGRQGREGVGGAGELRADRLSWFAKHGFAQYIGEFSAAYFRKAVRSGWLIKTGA
ncbi:hypothetical protein FGB62_51g00 [Gracilaria domingensis]|nr:hypothetical protein FGB62_51g00 [Gracilaria domingensis]